MTSGTGKMPVARETKPHVAGFVIDHFEMGCDEDIDSKYLVSKLVLLQRSSEILASQRIRASK